MNCDQRPVNGMKVGRKGILIGTVGYCNLRNFSVGPLLLPQLKRMRWPAQVRVEELNWGPIAIVQDLQSRPRLARAVLLGARPSGRPEGDVRLYRWSGGLPGPEAVQARIAEAVSGVISLDNLLIVGEHFGVWPEELFVVDVAPGTEQAGPTLSPAVAARADEILSCVRRLALQGPCLPLKTLRGDQLDGDALPSQA